MVMTITIVYDQYHKIIVLNVKIVVKYQYVIYYNHTD